MDMDMDMDMDMETLADDTDAALAGDSGGEAERYEAAEAEAELLRDRLRLAVISIATAEGSICISILSRISSIRGPVASCSRGSSLVKFLIFRCAVCAGKKAGMTVADPVVACIADLAYKSAGSSPRTLPSLHLLP